MTAELLDNTSFPGPETPLALRNRPWHVLSSRLNTRLDELADTDVWAMNHTETAETIKELRRAQAKLALVEARLLAHAERLDIAQHSSATSIAAWLRGQVPM